MNPTIFYIMGASAVFATLMAITRREMIHSVVYLVLSFFSLAVIFYMMGAPLIAALEVIVYAGAIMVLFIFVVMMLEIGRPKTRGPFLKVWGPAGLIAAVIVVCSGMLFGSDEGTVKFAGWSYISPRTFGHALYTRQMLAVEIVSLLLLFALVGALYLGKRE